MSDSEQLPGEATQQADYYRNARGWYRDIFLAPIADRSFYLIVIVLATLNFLYALSALTGMFPLRPSVAIVLPWHESWDKVPRILRISDSHTENKNDALMDYFLKQYVIHREAYDLKQYELRYRYIWGQSAEEPFAAYRNEIDANNPYSPYRQFTDAAHRDIDILSVDTQPTADGYQARIVFRATVVSNSTGQDIRNAKQEADITFRYKPFVISQRLREPSRIASFLGLTGKMSGDSGEGTDATASDITPMQFTVLDYQRKELFE